LAADVPKARLRSQLRETGREVGEEARREASRLAQERLLALPELGRAAVVALYAALPSEPDTGLLFERLRAAGKRVVYPGYAFGEPELREVRALDELRPGARGILHPPAGTTVAPEQVELFVVPGMAFDRHGHRLGRGQGYYDRLLARRSPASTAVGLCFDFALLDELTPEPHDVPVDYVAAPSGLFERPGRSR